MNEFTDEVPLLAGRHGRPDQVGIIVPSLEAAFPAYGAATPWRIWTYGRSTVGSVELRGGPGRFEMRIALNPTQPQIELIEPVAGPSVYDEWVAEHGYGLHHLGYFTDDLEAAIGAMADAGYALLQAGRGLGADGSGGFAYFDTTAVLGYIAEAIEPPAARRDPESVWPPAR